MKYDATDEYLSVDIAEVRPYAPDPRMSATVRAGVWSGVELVECKFKGGALMSVETAEMLRAALDLAIRTCRGG
jgi:hypothetical protein